MKPLPRVVVTRSTGPTSPAHQPSCAHYAFVQRGRSIVGFTEATIDESSFLRRITVVTH